jgi:hypothetical protein
LPVPTADGVVDSRLVDADFVETLMRAADDATIRQLIEARAQLIHSAWQWTNTRRPPSNDRPRSRDQLVCTTNDRACNAKEFAAAVRIR